MLEEALTGAVVVHVASGVLALLAGLGAIVSRPKGGGLHRKAGRVYVYAMAAALAAAIPLALVRESLFLLLLVVFVGYAVFTGYRVLSRKRPSPGEASAVDRVGHWSMVVTGLAMIGWGSVGLWQGSIGLNPVLVVFGGLGVWIARGELLAIETPPEDRRAWFFNHVGYMGGAYIGTVTAAVAVNLEQLPTLVAWLGPTAIGVPLIELTTRKYRRRFETHTRPEGIDPEALTEAG